MNSNDYSAAQVIAGSIHLSAPARRLLQDNMTPRVFIDALRAAGHHVDWLKYLPHMLDKRRAVWWACLCSFDAYREGMTPAIADALAVTLRWLHEPTEANRDACLGGGEVPKLNCVENCLRMAAHWSGGSMVPPSLPEVLPPPDLTAQLSSAAVLIAAASHGMFEIADRHALYVNLGYEVLDGRLSWPAATDVHRDEADAVPVVA